MKGKYRVGNTRVTIPGRPDLSNKEAVIKVGGKLLEEVILDNGGGGGSIEGSVRYDKAQELTHEQKSQAYVNLGITAEVGSLEGAVRYDGDMELSQQEKRTMQSNILGESSAFNKKGYKVVDSIQSFASQVIASSTIYEIRDYINLEGETIVIPRDCTLKFVGGMLDNGCIVGNNTTIDAQSAKIFGDNISLYQCCFSKKTGNIDEQVTYLPWVDVEERRVSLQNVANRQWKVTCSKRFSNADGAGVFSKHDGTLLVDSELLLEQNPSSFLAVNNGTNLNVISINTGTNELQTLSLSSLKNGNTLRIPHTSRWAFFRSRSEDLNNTYIAPDTIVDLTQGTIYCTYLARVYFDIQHSTFANDADLAWFVGDSYVQYSNIDSATDQSRNVQMALDCPMDLFSGIKGCIRVDETLFAETKKNLNLGAMYWVDHMNEWASNSKSPNKFNMPCTVFFTTQDNEMFVQRNAIDMYGGMFTTQFASSTSKDIFVVDGDYLTQGSSITTSIVGKKDNGCHNRSALCLNGQDTAGGFSSGSTFNCNIAYCKQGLLAENPTISTYFNSADVKLYVTGFYQGITIDDSLENSKLDIILQSQNVVPLAEVDNWRNSYINGRMIDACIVCWDFSHAKTNEQYQKPYRNIHIEGIGTTLNGVPDSVASGFDPMRNFSGYGYDPITKYAAMEGSGFKHYRFSNVFAGIPSDILSAKSGDCYFKKFSIPAGSTFNPATYTSKLTEESSLSSTDITTSVVQMANLFSNGSMNGTLKDNEFVEINILTKDATTYLDNHEYFGQIALFFNSSVKNIFKNVLVALDNVVVYNGEITGAMTEATFTTKRDAKEIRVRLYGDASYGYGSGVVITTSQRFVPVVMGWETHSSRAYLDRTYQKLLSSTTSQRPTSNLLKGMMVFDSTLGKPIWYAGGSKGWVDANGQSV